MRLKSALADAKRAAGKNLRASGDDLPPSIPRDPIGFLKRYLPFDLSPAWRAFFCAFYGLPILDEDRDVLNSICGFTEPNPDGYSEATAITGRRGGKSATTAAIALYEAVVVGPEHMKALSPGQRGYVPAVSLTQRQALEDFRYARAIVEHNAELLSLLAEPPLESQSGGELRFKSGVVLTVFPASKATVRGYTIIGAILDEFAWVGTDELSANQDAEILRAVKYGMLAPAGAPRRRLTIISSPAARSGVVYENYERYYGDPSAHVLVARGATTRWNPSIPAAELEAERERDPKAFAREVDAEFVDAISAWCEAAAIDACTVGRDEKPQRAQPWNRYGASIDAAFKRDRFVLSVGHFEDVEVSNEKPRKRFVVDGLWSWTPTPGVPLNSTRIVAACASVLRLYGIKWVVGDQFSSVPLASEFARHGVYLHEETATSPSKLEAFTKLREAIYGGMCSLPADELALKELKELEERVTGGGNVQIGHPNRASAHDDHAHAIAWLFAYGIPRADPIRRGSFSIPGSSF